MANVLAPFGFRPIRHRNGSPWNGQLQERKVQLTYATSMFKGDLVVVAATGYVTRFAAAGTRWSGVFMGCKYFDLTINAWVNSKYYPASVNANADIVCQIVDDENVVFEAQVGGAGTIAFADQGINVDIIATAGDTTTGISKESIDATTIAVTATLPLRILDRSSAFDNDNASQNNRVWVTMNAIDSKTTTGL